MKRVMGLIFSLFSTIAILAWYRDFEVYLVFLGLIAFHELGHALAALLMRMNFRIAFTGSGAFVEIIKDEEYEMPLIDEFLLTISSPYFSLVAFSLSCWFLFKGFETKIMSMICCISALKLYINLTPILEGTDGWRLGGIIGDYLNRRYEKDNPSNAGGVAVGAKFLGMGFPFGASIFAFYLIIKIVSLREDIALAFMELYEATPFPELFTVLTN